ncbi:MAG: hypothetical protein LBQ64_01375 [Bacteroidales bacterium]|jgi:hypothetical protein|nr:hypothetical protein [Bacteroidales bacterium]
MRKIIIPTAIVAVMFTSCNKYEESNPIDLGQLPTVTLSGNVYADLDETTPSLEYAPAGTEILVSIPYADYDANNASGGNHTISATIGEEGRYSVNIPVVSSGVTATISFADFIRDVKKQNSVGQQETTPKRFICNDISVSIGSGTGQGSRILVNAQYTSNAVDPNASTSIANPTHTVEVSGKIEYGNSDTTVTSIPEGTTFIAVITLTDPDGRTYKTTTTVSTGAAGTYRIQTPMVERGTASIKLDGEAFWIFLDVYTGKRALYRYVLNTSIGGIYNTPTHTNRDISYTRSTKINDID